MTTDGSHMVARDGFRLAAQVSGRADGKWIVLSNSLAASAAMWEPQLPVLEKRYRVLRYDTRGHGRSDAPAAPYTFPDLVGDVVALMDHFGIARADYMGLSLGGMTGLGLALAHPERVDRLVCCDARADNPPPFVAMWDARIAAIGKGGMEAILDATLERWFSADFATRDPAGVSAAAEMVLATDPEGYRGCAAALKTLDYLKDLGTMTVPVLYVVGSEDMGAPPATMRAMAEATPGAQFAEVAGAAHIANMDRPALFARAIAAFLDLS